MPAVPFLLRRRPAPLPAAALFLASGDASTLVHLCGRLGADPLPRVAPVADGFIVWPEADPGGRLPRTIPLRRLAENLLIPADADLVPTLHPDEAAALTRDRGLLMLPGRLLAFDPNRTLRLTAFLRPPPLRRDDWEPLPEGPPLADRLNAVHRILPPGLPPESVLDAGGEGIGTEEPRPPQASPGATIAGKASISAGKFLAKLGRAMGLKGLARLGAGLVAGGMSVAPRLSEQILGRQRAALEELLRHFREGRLEEALRRALPFGPDTPRASTGAGGADLPVNDPSYSLAGLLGWGSGRGPVAYWNTAEDLRRQLAEAYRKAALDALSAGDYRRAAFIYGRLLSDFALAADALARGGLHHDAGVLYRDKLGNLHRAAREFESAGEFDEALRLYRAVGEHERAGDLLKRMGEDEAALEEYLTAAKMLAGTQGCHAAGDFIFKKTDRSDLAAAFFELGWKRRSGTEGGATFVSVNGAEVAPARNPADVANAVPCAVRLAGIYAYGETTEPLFTLADEADEFLSPGNRRTEAGEFFNQLAEYGELPHLQSHRAELRDRALRGLARQLRRVAATEARPGPVVSELFGASGGWPPAVVSDAAFAVRVRPRRAEPAPPSAREIRLGSGTVTAAVCAAETGDVFVAFEGGDVVRFRPTTGEVKRAVTGLGLPVDGLACDAGGDVLVLLLRQPNSGWLRSYVSPTGGRFFEYRGERRVASEGGQPVRLLPVVGAGHDELTRYNTFVDVGGRLMRFQGVLLLPASGGEPEPEGGPTHHLVMPMSGGVQMILAGRRADFGARGAVELGWMPGVPDGAALPTPPLAWYLPHPARVELAGVTAEGALYWTAMERKHPHPNSPFDEERKLVAVRDAEGFRAVAMFGPGQVAAVTARNRVCWLRAGPSGFVPRQPQQTVLGPAPVAACFASFPTRELIVLANDGVAVRLPFPA
jgi:tetratricopeptide (TPR) repeat protein